MYRNLLIFLTIICFLAYLSLPKIDGLAEEATVFTATTTEDTASTSTSVTPSTTTIEIKSTSTESETISTTEENVLEEENISETESETISTTEENITQEEAEESVSEEIVLPPEPVLPPKPPLKERKINKNFNLSKEASHRCEAETFVVDISGKQSAQARIIFSGKKVNFGEIEIGNLPLGIDIKFLNNQDYLHLVSANDDAFDLEIINQEGSSKGSFNIPILYTDKETNQTTICQINIINF